MAKELALYARAASLETVEAVTFGTKALKEGGVNVITESMLFSLFLLASCVSTLTILLQDFLALLQARSFENTVFNILRTAEKLEPSPCVDQDGRTLPFCNLCGR